MESNRRARDGTTMAPQPFDSKAFEIPASAFSAIPEIYSTASEAPSRRRKFSRLVS